MTYQIYTDGATSNNGKSNAVGGWAFVILKNEIEIAAGAEKVEPATNNICEMLAILNSCQTIFPLLDCFDEVEVYSDSAYCINCANQKWYRKWRCNNWVTSSKTPVLNKEIWEQLIMFFEDPRFVWKKIQGHSGNKWNEKVDQMAVRARLNK